jgi:hypothetical protein
LQKTNLILTSQSTNQSIDQSINRSINQSINFLEFLRQRVSIEIQRGNAASVIGTHPYSRGLDEVYSVLRVKP